VPLNQATTPGQQGGLRQWSDESDGTISINLNKYDVRLCLYEPNIVSFAELMGRWSAELSGAGTRKRGAGMAEVSRRGFLGGASALAGVVVGGPWTVGSSAAWARGDDERSRAGSVHAALVRDARMVWRRVPDHWQNAPFLGNGFLGAQVYRAAQTNVLKVVLSHTEVQDQRDQWEAAIGLSRLPIGYLTLTLAGSITAVDWELDLWNAELTGSITTTQGSVTLSALVHNSRSVLLVSLSPSAGEETAAWAFHPLESATPRPTRKPPEYVPNPPPTVGTSGPTHYAEQPMLAGGGYTTAWQEKRVGTRRLLAVVIAYSFPEATSTASAVRAVQAALGCAPDRLVATHRAWWHRFYTRSLVSVPDKLVQRFYWIQLYKMASTTRDNAPVVAEWGAWYPEEGNGWTAVWWNLNVQAAYPMVNGSNHPELDAVTATFRRYHRNLELSVPPAYRDGETYALSHPGDRTLRPGGVRTVGIPGPDNTNDQTGNLIWGMHNVWLGYRHSMDTRVLRDVIYPILGKAVNYYLRFLTEGTDGRLHLPQTRSPEYANATDATYDLSLIRWGCRTLVESAQLLRIDDPRLPRWRDVLARLVAYHQDPAAGVMIGAGVPLAQSHRHYSHLLWLYPLREALWDNLSDRPLMRRTFDHWISMRVRWHGYSFAAASSMASVMDSPEEALSFLRFFLDRNIVDNTQLTPNTMYREGRNFAIESPLTAAQSVLDMLVQSAGSVVKVFPSVSGSWADASIAGLRTEGAFTVDASRTDGRTDWIRIRSEAGQPLVLQHGIDGELQVRNERGRPLAWRPVAPGRIAVRLCRGEAAVLSRRGARPDLRPRDVPANGTAPQWGLPS
jgi:alpha-L-fucosidase 2